MQIRKGLQAMVLVLSISAVGCQANPGPPTVPPTPAVASVATATPVVATAAPKPTPVAPVPSPSPRSEATATPRAEAPSTTASRVDVLAAAEAAVRAGDARTAVDLYARAINTPPSTGETAASQAAVTGLAGLRRVILLAHLDQEDSARRQLEAMQSQSPQSPFTRVAAEFWHAYGQTGSVRNACAQVAPNLPTVLTAALAPLADTPARLDPTQLCPP